MLSFCESFSIVSWFMCVSVVIKVTRVSTVSANRTTLMLKILVVRKRTILSAAGTESASVAAVLVPVLLMVITVSVMMPAVYVMTTRSVMVILQLIHCHFFYTFL